MICRSVKNKSFSVGVYGFVEKFYSRLELFDVIDGLKVKGVPLGKLVRGMVCFKLEHNLSVHKCAEWLNQLHILNQFQLKTFHEKTLYRALEILGQNEGLVLLRLRGKLFSLYRFEHTDVNIDWSSLVLHGKASPLGRFGFSSDRRPDKRQVTFGVGELGKPVNVPFVLTVKEGNVVSKTHFKDTFLRCVKHLKPESLVVIDRGANTRQNKELVRSKGMHFLTAKILSSKDNKIISKFSVSDAKKIVRKKKKEEEWVYCKKVKQENEFLYICFSPKLYESQISVKQKKIDEDLKTIKTVSEMERTGKKVKPEKTINLSDKIIEQKIMIQERLVNMNEKQIRKHLETIHVNRREGFYILETSKDLTEKQAIETYKDKDTIEKVMNSLKNEIEIKPIRVWTESSIKGALIIGFLAQIFISLARYEHKELKKLTTTTILKSLKNLTLTIKNPKTGLIEQIISNINWITQLILPKLTLEPG